MKTCAFLFMAAFVSCQPKSAVSPGNERIEAAYITDDTYIADGCEDHVWLYKNDSLKTIIQYKPTSATLPLLHLALAQIPPSTNSTERAVIIRFTETGKQVELLCGWGARPKVGEIDILSIAKR